MFDNDGRQFVGRADCHGLLKLKIRGGPSKDQLRQKISLVWAILRLQYPLLRATASRLSPAFITGSAEENRRRHFIVKSPRRIAEENTQEALTTLVFVDDSYPHIDPADFLKHAENTDRIIDPSQSLSKLFVLPLITLPDHTHQLPLFFVFAHQITDGLTLYNWLPRFHILLNQPLPSLQNTLSLLSSPNPLPQVPVRLPPAQEDLYPPISGSHARQSWSWLLLRILRHVRRPLPPAFPNPLSRTYPLPSGQARPCAPSYPALLNYSITPPLNTHRAKAVLSPAASRRFHALARTADVSTGSLAFALVGLAMQSLHAELHPTAPRNAFIGSFPLNPRPLLCQSSGAEPDSLMLAFSDGLVLPFLPTGASVEGRLKVLARRAQAQLKGYQRRVVKEGRKREVLQGLYVMSGERCRVVTGGEEGVGFEVQGAYPARANPTGATCGVSWVGSVEAFLRGPRDGAGNEKEGTEGRTYQKEDYQDDSGPHKHLEEAERKQRGREGKEFEALWMDVSMGVRVREREFLVGGTMLGDDRVVFGASYDGNAYDEALVRRWEEKMKILLLEDTPNSRL
ncbi:MAG: hypothetical protein M1822_000101 [Bathelium mastoideum]|nr:MAG: hypothetical protein M1822_000101 [Bathelium mastoideum]